MGIWDSFPEGIAALVQDGILDGAFQQGLYPETVFKNLGQEIPTPGGIGTKQILTKPGLMPVSTTPNNTSDATVNNYGFEQYSVTIDNYSSSIPTNLTMSAMAFANKFVQDQAQIGRNAALTLNALATTALYEPYGSGATYATETTTTATSLTVEDGYSFAQAYTIAAGGSGNAIGLNAAPSLVLAAVSATNPLAVTIGGVANTVTNCVFSAGTSGPATLTLGTAASVANGAAVVSSQGALGFYANGRASVNQIVAGDLPTLSLIQSARARLVAQGVPMIRGAYTVLCPPETMTGLYQDPAFQSAARGAVESPVYKDLALGRFLGCDWVENNLVPMVSNQGGVEVYRPIMLGQGALIRSPFTEMGSLLAGLAFQGVADVQMIGGVARIIQAPLDRQASVVNTTWRWIGDYTCGTDALMERGQPNTSTTSALYKRAVVLSHA